MQEFLSYGVRYYSQPDPVGYGRGIPSGWHCPPLIMKSSMILPETPIVWESSSGSATGEQISPIHPSAIKVSVRSSSVYQVLALVDLLRIGTAREVAIARDLLAVELNQWKPQY
jgi:hypothetical protein